VEVLTQKTLRAVRETGCRRVVLGGGVANSRALRGSLRRRLGKEGVVYAPSPRLSTDNAPMIASAALYRIRRDGAPGLELNARADLPFPGLARRDAAVARG
jgi:N6-L-threonylcarbamoyladenine synthase